MKKGFLILLLSIISLSGFAYNWGEALQKATYNYVEFPVTIIGPTIASGSIYYFQVSFNDGTSVYPGGNAQYAAEVQLRITPPSGATWDASNDPSLKGLTNTDTKTSNIPVYDGTTLIFGTEPGGGGNTPVVTPVPTPESTPNPQNIPLTISIVAAAGTTVIVDIEPGNLMTSSQRISGSNGTSVTVQYQSPVPVTFTASANSGMFCSWTGALSGSTNPSTLYVDRVLSVTASFVEVQPIPIVTPAPTSGTGLLGDVNKNSSSKEELFLLGSCYVL